MFRFNFHLLVLQKREYDSANAHGVCRSPACSHGLWPTLCKCESNCEIGHSNMKELSYCWIVRGWHEFFFIVFIPMVGRVYDKYVSLRIVGYILYTDDLTALKAFIEYR